jgi:hypothetical protein
MLRWAVEVDGRLVPCGTRHTWRNLYAIARGYRNSYHKIYVHHRGTWRLING